MKQIRIILMALAVLLGGSAAVAQSQETLTLTSAGSTTAFGYYVGPYQAAVGPQPGALMVDLFCVDFFHHVTVGQTWTANFTQLGDGVDLSLTRGGAGSLDKYRQVAWLTTQFGEDNKGEWGAIHGAIWNIFGANLAATGSGYWMDEARNNYETLDFTQFAVITDVNKSDPNSVQEFLVRRTPPSTVTPEPISMMLLGTGLAGVGAARRRRKKNA